MIDKVFDEDEFEDDETEEALLASDSDLLNPIKNEIIPKVVSILPIARRPYFPGMAAPIMIEKGPHYDLLKSIIEDDNKFIGIVLIKDEEQDPIKARIKDVYSVGVLARILRIIPMDQGGAQVILNMERRMTIIKGVKSKFLQAEISTQQDESQKSERLKAYSINIISSIKELIKLNPLFKEELQIFLGHSDFTEPGKLADFAAALTTSSRSELQEILESFDLDDRMAKTLLLLKKEIDLSKLQHNIHQKIEYNISKAQRDFFLKEQLRTIKKELGLEKDDKACDIDKFQERIKKYQIPPDVENVMQEEMDKLLSLDPLSSEYSVCRSYLDWLTAIPWGVHSQENHNLAVAEKILNKDHYGLEDIKERILEFISVGQLTNGVKGSIICLVGPPGVGKTSIGKSIANTLHRKFYRFSVGGMRDEAEIKGHRRTYIGAMPGKLVQALKYTGSMNPVIMIDEVDKIGSSYQGDPASALLEVLDPEQNSDFLDHYMDTKVDLSNVLFILTANVLDTIPEPLKDRMEILRLSGYVLEDKLKIATKYLIPRHRKETGITASQVKFTTSGLKSLIHGYSREAGVRGLSNYIKKILRKIAVQIVRSKEGKKKAKQKDVITKENIHKYIGQPIHTSDRLYNKVPIGVCTGLAWTSLGGATLYIEALQVPSEKRGMKLTGQAGDVMKESSQIAWSFAQSELKKLAPNTSFFEKALVHLHIPEGATPKDGPSAGVTMTTALLSLLLKKAIPTDLGMTGELTLTGKVLPVGGIKEKLIAAKRSGLKTIILPKDNLRDFDELPEHIKKSLTIKFASYYQDVFDIAFAETKKKTKRKAKKKTRKKA